MTTVATKLPQPIRSTIPARLDRLRWSPFHTRLVLGLGTAWILDGLEITIASSVTSKLTQANTLNLSTVQAASIGTVYLVGEIAGALVFGRLSDKLGRRNLFMWTLAIYLVGTGLSALAMKGTGGMIYFYATRFIAGSGIGGEYSAVNSAIDEMMPARYRGRTDIWIRDLARDAMTRLTFDPHDEWTPIWSPDDSHIVYGSDARGSGDIMMKRSSGTGSEEVLYANRSFKVATDWSPDGKTILFQQENSNAGTDWDLYLYSLEERKAVPFLRTPFAEIGASFSPDGRWVLYFSNESGKPEAYVQPLSRSGAKWQISTNGGSRPRWSRDGKRIYYVSLDGKLMAVDVYATGDEFFAKVPRVLLQTNMKRYVGSPFDVSPDGRILVTVSMNQGDLAPLTLVQNWTAALKK